MKSKTKVKMMLLKQDPEKRRYIKRDTVEHEIENEGKDNVTETGPRKKKKY